MVLFPLKSCMSFVSIGASFLFSGWIGALLGSEVPDFVSVLGC